MLGTAIVWFDMAQAFLPYFLQLRFRLILWVRFPYCYFKIWHGLAIFYSIIYILDSAPRSPGQNKNLHLYQLQF